MQKKTVFLSFLMALPTLLMANVHAKTFSGGTSAKATLEAHVEVVAPFEITSIENTKENNILSILEDLNIDYTTSEIFLEGLQSLGAITISGSKENQINITVDTTGGHNMLAGLYQNSLVVANGAQSPLNIPLTSAINRKRVTTLFLGGKLISVPDDKTPPPVIVVISYE